MNPVMYAFINRGLGMSPGKIAAQAGHAFVRSALFSAERNDPLLRAWEELGEAKVTLLANDTEDLRNAMGYIEERGFKIFPVFDEGRTEVDPISFTALGVVVCDKDEEHVQFTFQHFPLYHERRPETLAQSVWRKLI